MALFQEQDILQLPHYPSMMIPRFVAILGIISAAITRDKEISGMLKLGGINIMPLLGSVIAK